jgi:xanthine dehydrogenase YagR molybdenum-binding subunit
MQANAVLSGVYATTNLTPVPPGTFVRGDVNGATGFSAADVTLQTTTAGWTTTYQHNDLEAHQAVAWWNGPDCYVWCGSQAPFTFKSTLVNGLGIPANRVHFFTHGMGGGLGDRLAAPELVPTAVMSLKVNGHPVNLIETRKEQNLMQIRQAQNKGDIKWGAKKDGTIVAASGDWYGVGSGASGCYFGIDNTYTIPNLSWSYQSVYTNAPARSSPL